MGWIKILWILAVGVVLTLAGEENHKNEEGGINDRNGAILELLNDDEDLLKAESQDLIEHKSVYQPQLQGQFEGGQQGGPPNNHHQMNYHPGGAPGKHDGLAIPVPMPHPMARPGHIMIPNLPPQKGQHNPQHGYPGHAIPQPVYPGHGLPPQQGHPAENQVEYGPELNQGHQYPHPGYEQPQQPPPQQQPQPQQSNNNQQQQNQNQKELWPLPAPDMPKIVHLDVKCEKNLMKVAVEFNKPFSGMIFSKGHYSYGNCVHLPAGSGRSSVYFDISINSCGTTGNTQNGLYGYGAQSGSGTFFENTVVIQYDPQVQEVWDQARKLRCTWHDQYEKSVTFRPFPVDMLDVVRADFAGDNVGCWMQIQVGKGPWASEVAGIVKIGQTMTMVLAIKDEENKFDMLVRNCIAHDGKRAPIELVDSLGCIVRPKLMSRFTKIKNFGSSATVLSYAHFQAFKFPDSMEVHFQCTIQICRFQCPEQCTQSQTPGQVESVQQHIDGYASQSSFHNVGKPREERDLSAQLKDLLNSAYTAESETEIGVNKIIQVVSTGDLAFTLQDVDNETVPLLETNEMPIGDMICMSTVSFTSAMVILIVILVISCMLSVFMCLRQRSLEKSTAKLSDLALPFEIKTIPRKQPATICKR